MSTQDLLFNTKEGHLEGISDGISEGETPSRQEAWNVQFKDEKVRKLFLGDPIMRRILCICTILVLGGCTSRLDSGRLLGLGLDISVGENTTAMSTAVDKTTAGQSMTNHRPTAEAVTSNGGRGFRGLEVNHE